MVKFQAFSPWSYVGRTTVRYRSTTSASRLGLDPPGNSEFGRKRVSRLSVTPIIFNLHLHIWKLSIHFSCHFFFSFDAFFVHIVKFSAGMMFVAPMHSYEFSSETVWSPLKSKVILHFAIILWLNLKWIFSSFFFLLAGNSEMFIEAFTLTLPLNYIPGSEKAKAVMLGMLDTTHNLLHFFFYYYI